MYWAGGENINQMTEGGLGGLDYEQAYADGTITEWQYDGYFSADFNEDGFVNNVDLMIFINAAATLYNLDFNYVIGQWIESGTWQYPYYP